MNNKGFTLIELLAAIIILTLVTSVTMISVISLMNRAKEQSYEIMVSNIKTAAKTLYEECTYNDIVIGGQESTDLPINCPDIVIDASGLESMTFSLESLVGSGYLRINTTDEAGNKIIRDPVTNENIGCCNIKITKNVGNNYSVNYNFNNIQNASCLVTCPTY